jgi:hypothetical protein
MFVHKYWPNDPKFGCNAPKIMGGVVDLKVDLGENSKVFLNMKKLLMSMIDQGSY